LARAGCSANQKKNGTVYVRIKRKNKDPEFEFEASVVSAGKYFYANVNRDEQCLLNKTKLGREVMKFGKVKSSNQVKFSVKQKIEGNKCVGYILSTKAVKDNYRVSEWGTQAPSPRKGGKNDERIVWQKMTEDE